jgi:hypothetical protein
VVLSGGVEIELAVHVQQARRPGVQPLKPGHDGEGDRAIAAENQDSVTIAEQPDEPFGEFYQTASDLVDVLRQWPPSVWPPDLLRQVPVIADHKPGVVQRLAEASVTQRRRRLVLPGSVAARAARHADDANVHLR